MGVAHHRFPVPLSFLRVLEVWGGFQAEEDAKLESVTTETKAWESNEEDHDDIPHPWGHGTSRRGAQGGFWVKPSQLDPQSWGPGYS